jgi:hypothetical protein
MVPEFRRSGIVPWLMGLSVAQSLLGSLGRRSLGDSTSDDVPLFDAYEFAGLIGFFGDGLGRLVSELGEDGAVVILSTMFFRICVCE